MENNEQHQEALSLQEQLNLQQEALIKIYKSVEQTRKVILWTGIINIAVFVLPLIFVVIALPRIIGTFTSSVGGLSGGIQTVSEIVDNPSLSESLERLEGFGF
ncbi:MAG: hypothetical protein ACJAV6_000622 [Candidatus Paceibacteria bacterium]|jgi:hypothetical protein